MSIKHYLNYLAKLEKHTVWLYHNLIYNHKMVILTLNHIDITIKL
jgi:hypothetical protein